MPSSQTENILLRLDPDLALQIRAVAEVEGRSVSDVMREALAHHVATRREDPDFARLLKENLSKHRRLLSRLRAEDGAGR
jgi:uncharacterized protein (DUF1778 family)